MAARCRDKRSNNSHQIIVHITRISKGSCARRHNSRNELIRLLKRWLLYVKSVCSYSRQCSIIEDDLFHIQYVYPFSSPG